MEGQEASLSLRKSTHVEWTVGVETHAAQGLHVGRGRKQDIAVVLEPNETAVEEVVRGRRQEKAVLAVKALLVAGVAPRLAVAGPQVLFLVHAGDAAGAFDSHDPLLDAYFGERDR